MTSKGLNFLNKKSWHTGTLKNIERVWKAEQEQNAEDKQIAILKRELQEERQIEDLMKLHETQTGHRRRERVDWLYNEPMMGNISAHEANKHALGKTFEGKPGEKEEVKQLEEKPGSLWLDKPRNPEYDRQLKAREDPMFAIRQREIEERMKITKNPILMNRLKKKLLQKQLEKQLKKASKKKKRKKDKDKRHKDKKHKRQRVSSPDRDHHKRSRDSSDRNDRKRSRDSDDESRRSSKRQRRDDDGSFREPRDRDDRGRRDDRREDRRSSRRDRSRDGDRRDLDRRNSRDSGRDRRSSDRRDYDRRDSDRRRDRRDDRRDSRDRRDDRRDSRDKRDDDRRDRHKRDSKTKEVTIKKEDKGDEDDLASYLPEHLRKSHGDMLRQKQETRKKLAASKAKVSMTAEEKAERLRQMKNDASKHEEFRTTRLLNRAKKDKHEEEEYNKRIHADDKLHKADFIEKFQEKVFNDRMTGNLEDRIKRRKYFLAKDEDD